MVPGASSRNPDFNTFPSQITGAPDNRQTSDLPVISTQPFQRCMVAPMVKVWHSSAHLRGGGTQLGGGWGTLVSYQKFNPIKG